MDAAILVQGLGFGDEGKGTITDALVAEVGARLVVRFCGGHQATHHVVLPDGRWHGFSQWGSGTFAGAKTHLSGFMRFDPFAMVPEAEHLQSFGCRNPFGLLSIDPRALVVTPLHLVMNRLRERARGSDAHGSCGLGIGEAVADHLLHPELTIHAEDLTHGRMKDTLEGLFELKHEEALMMGWDTRGLTAYGDPATLAEMYHQIAPRLRLQDDDDVLRETPGPVVFEGAQGVLLDETHGFHPYTTWADCTFAQALHLLAEAGYDGPVMRVGVTRTYATRHGAGPFPSEGSEISPIPWMPDFEHNTAGPWQGRFRVGHCDLLLLDYAVRALGGVDWLAVTHCDRPLDGWVVRHYEDPDGAVVTALPLDLQDIEQREDLTTRLLQARAVYRRTTNILDDLRALAPVGIESHGPHRGHKRFSPDMRAALSSGAGVLT